MVLVIYEKETRLFQALNYVAFWLVPHLKLLGIMEIKFADTVLFLVVLESSWRTESRHLVNTDEQF